MAGMPPPTATHAGCQKAQFGLFVGLESDEPGLEGATAGAGSHHPSERSSLRLVVRLERAGAQVRWRFGA